MSQIGYSGSARSASELSSALSSAGYEVTASTPGSPRQATDFWGEARSRFSAQGLETGGLRDYRAILRSRNGNQLVRVPVGSTLSIDESGVSTRVPSGADPREPGMSQWQDTRTNRVRRVFVWDGTEPGFSDLIAFFQVNGSELNMLSPAHGSEGWPVLIGTATLLSSGRVTEFEMTRRTAFVRSDAGAVETMTAEQLTETHRRIDGSGR